MASNSIDDAGKSTTTTSTSNTESTNTFKISEWPSNDYLLQHESQRKQSCQSCFKSNGKLSVLSGRRRQNLPNMTIIEYFVTQIEASNGKIVPSDTALITKTKNYTYQELHEKSDQIAAILKTRLEGKQTTNPDGDVVVAVAFPGRERRILTKLAILKTGCCYFPIDFTNFPRQRILNMTNLIKPILIITSEDPGTTEKMEVIQTAGIFELITIEEIWRKIESKSVETNKMLDRKSLLLCQDYADRPVAIYYASGHSVPQGIRIGNKALWNRVMWEWETFPYANHEKLVLQSHVWEIQALAELYTPLLAGKSILITDRTHLNRLLDDVRKHKVTRLAGFPSFLSSLMTTMDLYKQLVPDPCCHTLLPDMKLWFCYRASLRAETARKFFDTVAPGTKLVQIHGALETLQIASYKVFESPKSFKDLAFYEVLPAGNPISNMKVYITDDQKHLVKQGYMGEISISGIQIPFGTLTSSEELVPNPFYKHGDDESHTYLLKSGDYGRIIPGSCLTSPALIFDGRVESQCVMNNQRVNIKEILFYLRAIQGVKGCHAMAYRPTTTDQAVLAFAVPSRRNPISMLTIVEKLREDLPEYMMPLLILVEGIPIGKDFQVNQSALIEAYFTDREERMKFDDWDQLELDNSGAIRAAKVLFDVMFTLTRISKKAIAESMNESIFKLRAGFSNMPSILQRLWRNGYNIGFDEIIEIKNVRELIERMAIRRDAIAERERRVWRQAYEVEEISPKIQNEVLDFSSNTRGSGTLFYHAEIKRNQVIRFLKSIWELLMKKPLSLFARRIKDRKVVGALINVGFEDKVCFKNWKATGSLKYILEFIEHFDKCLEEIDRTRTDLLETVFLVADSASIENYDAAVSMLDKLFHQTIELANQNGFKSYSVISFDYVITSTAIDLFGFELVSSIQINSFEAQDKRKPFKLAPDDLIGSLLLKSL